MACRTNGGEDECIQNIGGKPEGKKLIGRPRRRLEANNKMDLKQVGWGSMDWMYLVRDRD
jgi:hypothetical protein